MLHIVRCPRDECAATTVMIGRWLHVSTNHPPPDQRARMLNVWIGPAGVHVCWPDIHKSRPDWLAEWREPVSW